MPDDRKPWAWEGVDVGDLCGLGDRDTLRLGNTILELRRPEEWSPRERYRFTRLSSRTERWNDWMKHIEQDGPEAEKAALEAMERADAEAAELLTLMFVEPPTGLQCFAVEPLVALFTTRQAERRTGLTDKYFRKSTPSSGAPASTAGA